MRTVHAHFTVASVVALSALFLLVSPGLAGSWVTLVGDEGNRSQLQPYQDYAGNPLGDCEQDCRSRFGVDPYADVQFRGGRGGGGSGFPYYAYANCIQQCNTKFWKRFDKEMDDIGK
jgi:hypothetical protein